VTHKDLTATVAEGRSGRPECRLRPRAPDQVGSAGDIVNAARWYARDVLQPIAHADMSKSILDAGGVIRRCDLPLKLVGPRKVFWARIRHECFQENGPVPWTVGAPKRSPSASRPPRDVPVLSGWPCGASRWQNRGSVPVSSRLHGGRTAYSMWTAHLARCPVVESDPAHASWRLPPNHPRTLRS